MGIVLEDVLVAGFNSGGAEGAAAGDGAPLEEVSFNYGKLTIDYYGGTSGGAGRDVLVGGLGGDAIGAGAGKSEFAEFTIVKTTDGTLPDGTEARGQQQTEQQVTGMFGAPAAADGSKGGNIEFEWKVEEGEKSGDVFGFKSMEAADTHLPSVTDMVIDSFDTGRLLIGNGGNAGWLYGDGGDGSSAAAGWGGLHYRYGNDDLATFQPDTGGQVGGAGGLFFGTGGAGGGIPVTMAEYGLMIA